MESCAYRSRSPDLRCHSEAVGGTVEWSRHSRRRCYTPQVEFEASQVSLNYVIGCLLSLFPLSSGHYNWPYCSFQTPLRMLVQHSRRAAPPLASIRFAYSHKKRRFSSSPAAHASVSHYDTLSIPKNATRSQIKVRSYGISITHYSSFIPDSDIQTSFYKVGGLSTTRTSNANKALRASLTRSARSITQMSMTPQRQKLSFRLQARHIQCLETNAKGMLIFLSPVHSWLTRMVLDDARRAYDRTLTVGPSHTYQQHHHRHPAATHDYDPGAWAYETRRRGASYAWEKTRNQSRSWYGRPPPGMHYDPSDFDPFGSHSRAGRARANTHFRDAPPKDDPMRNPWANANVRRATGKNNPMSEENRAQHISPTARALGVVALVLAVATIGGGWSAKT
jgi:hypothetical protein